jgi:hypothetical protein
MLQVPVSIPLAFVNREARSIALAYIRDLGLKKRRVDGESDPVFTRSFDRLKDAVYMDPTQLNAILLEADERLHKDDMVGQHVSIWSEFRRIAMPYASLASGDTMQYIGELEFHYCSVDGLLVVVDGGEGLEKGEACGFESARGPAYFWRRDDQVFRRWEEGDGENGSVVGVDLGEIVCTEDVRLAFSGVGPRFGCGQSSFMVRPVNAIRAWNEIAVRWCELLRGRRRRKSFG